MAKTEWGTKRTCPKCGERFYDLRKPSPLECVACGATFEPEVVLKSKQPAPVEEVKKPKKVRVETADDGDLDDIKDVEIEDDEESEDLIEDDDIDDDDVTDVISKRPSGGDET
ncbi:MAG: FYDLN acid domain-containing protein [Sphingomonadales bacterium]